MRQWTISWTVPSDPGTGGVYVEGPVLEYGESVTVVEVDPQPRPIVYLYADDDASPWLKLGYRVWRSPLKRPPSPASP